MQNCAPASEDEVRRHVHKMMKNTAKLETELECSAYPSFRDLLILLVRQCVSDLKIL